MPTRQVTDTSPLVQALPGKIFEHFATGEAQEVRGSRDSITARVAPTANGLWFCHEVTDRGANLRLFANGYEARDISSSFMALASIGAGLAPTIYRCEEHHPAEVQQMQLTAVVHRFSHNTRHQPIGLLVPQLRLLTAITELAGSLSSQIKPAPPLLCLRGQHIFVPR